MSQDTADTLPEEDRLEETSEREALLGSSGTPEVEDSFLQPHVGNPEKIELFLGFFFYSNVPEKGNMTKLECSTTETEKAIFVFTLSTQFCLFFLSIALSTSETTKWLEIMSMMLSYIYWKLAPIKMVLTSHSYRIFLQYVRKDVFSVIPRDL